VPLGHRVEQLLGIRARSRAGAESQEAVAATGERQRGDGEKASQAVLNFGGAKQGRQERLRVGAEGLKEVLTPAILHGFRQMGTRMTHLPGFGAPWCNWQHA
jgi:hypothetical protein